jgi:hypothetical protein
MQWFCDLRMCRSALQYAGWYAGIRPEGHVYFSTVHGSEKSIVNMRIRWNIHWYMYILTSNFSTHFSRRGELRRPSFFWERRASRTGRDTTSYCDKADLYLKGLSHEMDLNNFWHKCLIKGRDWFKNFWGLWWLYNANNLIIAANASLRWLNNASFLFFHSC